ncbi:MAG: NAD(P)/FAD-dependent oxidoreductase [Pseudomonadota bacterium]
MSNDASLKNISNGEDYDVVVAGAGFAGMYAVYVALQRGLSVLCIEKASDVGGTWYWNRYPGARCDVESIYYSYSFDEDLQREWRWSERYATQPEILAYAQHVADRFDLRRHIRFEENVVNASFSDDTARWRIETDRAREIYARFMILTLGNLSTPLKPGFKDLDQFKGEVYYTAEWPKSDVDVSGKRVALIGGGSSGNKAAPHLAEKASQLTVFQRTPNFSVPIKNMDLSDSDWADVQAKYSEIRNAARTSFGGTRHEPHSTPYHEATEKDRQAAFERGWTNGGVLYATVFEDQLLDQDVNDAAAAFAAKKVREIVKDPRTADDLIPTDHPIGAKRICTDNGYFSMFNRENVDLVNLRKDPIVGFFESGVETKSTRHEFDVVVIATGFDAMTGSVLRLDLNGPRGERMQDTWSDGPVTLLGVGVPGFPNLFNIMGPGSPSVLANGIMGAEQQVDWVYDLIQYTDDKSYTMVEARKDAAAAWTGFVTAIANHTLFVKGKTWYTGANVEGKPRVFMAYVGGLGPYAQYCSDIRDADYKGFIFSA